MPTATPFARPVYVMLKPAGSRCNMDCSYCYYRDKGLLAGDSAPAVMSDALLETFTRQYIEAQTAPQVLFTWHGGEPLLRPMSFYRRAIELQQRYAGGRAIDNCLQTNGTLLTDEWCAFLRRLHFLVGLSIDGPQPVHDRYRRTLDRRPTWQQVMRAAYLLEKHGVEWNAMAVVHAANAGDGRTFYRFFRDMGCRYLQFTPVVERRVSRPDGLSLAPGMTGWAADADEARRQTTPETVTPGQWGQFLCDVYDEWVQRDVGRVFVQLFDATLANWAGEPPGICALSARCGHAAVMESGGDVYSCDHFVFPEHRLGNIAQTPLATLLYGEQQQRFGRIKHDALPRQCRECPYLFACHGECPKNRFVCDSYGQPGLNYLCAGYRQFFSHVAPDMDYMKNELDHGRAPANIMQRDNETTTE